MSPTPPSAPRPPGLGPHCVGERVVVRRLVRGETGPTGGPAMTDLLGTMLAWGPSTTVVQAESGERVTIELADIVSGKPVPPRPSTRLRVSAEEAERRAVLGWPPVESEPLGSWVLRAASGFSARANSVLAVGSPGLDLDQAVEAVRAFYTSRDLPPWAQVVVGSDQEAALVERGWVTARPGEGDSEFQIASVAQLSRALRHHRADHRIGATVDEEWLADDTRARATPEAARAVLEGPAQVGFVSVGSPLVAKGRVSLADDWAGITDVWVSPERRRQGHALAVLTALVEWSAERGASTAYLQTRSDNQAALGLYARLGFVTHHTYRYLTPGG
ncbi:MAG: GNAT family N-acetyltransferase [Nocardioides sp.]